MDDTAIFESNTESLQSFQPIEVQDQPQPDQNQMYENRVDDCILGVMDQSRGEE